ncbi:MAG: ribosome maturation factor RimP [Candidatus Omnitrophota bacterium]
MSLVGVPEELREHIREEAERSNYRLVGITTKGGDSFLMEVVLDKEGGITLDECGEFNRRISSWVEEQNLFRSGFTLDVSSPGLDRELKEDGDFSWAVGKEVKITVHEPVNGKSAIIGILVEADAGKDLVVEEDEGNKLTVARGNIAKARLWVKI